MMRSIKNKIEEFINILFINPKGEIYLRLSDLTIVYILEFFKNSAYGYRSAISYEKLRNDFINKNYDNPDEILEGLINMRILKVEKLQHPDVFLALTDYGITLWVERYGRN